MQFVDKFNKKYPKYYSDKFVILGKKYRIKPFQFVLYNLISFTAVIAFNWIAAIYACGGK